MEDRVVRMRLMLVIVLTAFSVAVWSPSYFESAELSQNLEVHFLDIGQGDAIFIETPDGIQVLVDGGRDSTVIRRLGEQMSFSDRTIDLVVGTHPDSDHIGGLVDVLERYEVKSVLMTENKGKSNAAIEYERLVQAEGATINFARKGQLFKLGASTTLEVLWPETDPTTMESNASSIVLKLTYGQTAFILTGDSPKQIEEYLVLAYGEHLKANVLKVGHHGSRTSASELFLDEVNPEFAVLSYGANNRYGHPHVEVTDMLFNHGIETLSTAEEGTMTFLSDGEKVLVGSD